MKLKLLLPLLCIILLVPTLASAIIPNQEITLLAVSQYDNGTLKGSTATMSLQLKPGTGAIFIESYPVAKIDTQVATRLAKEIACEFSETDCAHYDFFYTIRAGSPIVGGPSGGGATAVLTLASLEGLELKKNIAMTGSITSGGIIGPVAGIKEKIDAAQNKHKLAIVPELAFYHKNETMVNETNNLTFFGDNTTEEDTTLYFEDYTNMSEEIYLVTYLPDAVNMATMKGYKHTKKELEISTEYLSLMKDISEELCLQSQKLQEQIPETNKNNSLYIKAQDYLNKSRQADYQEHYTRASFCFSANLQLRQLTLINTTQEVLYENYQRLNRSIQDFSASIDEQELTTLADLEAYVIVTERLLEAQQYIDVINETNISYSLLGLAIERYSSAVAWSDFFLLEDTQTFELNEQSLSYACREEIQNVETRLNYLQLLLPAGYLQGVQADLEIVQDYKLNGDYALCLFKATKTKARADLFLSSLMIEEKKMPELIQAKRTRTQEILSQDKELFGILGYSYYEYANSFVEEEPYTGLMFAEYALVFSDLSDYFPKTTSYVEVDKEIQKQVITLLIGFTSGMLLMWLYMKRTPKKRSTQKHTKDKKTRQKSK